LLGEAENQNLNSGSVDLDQFVVEN